VNGRSKRERQQYKISSSVNNVEQEAILFLMADFQNFLINRLQLELHTLLKKYKIENNDGKRHRHRKFAMSDAEIITIMIGFHYGSFRNLKHFYLYYVGKHLQKQTDKTKQGFQSDIEYSRHRSIANFLINLFAGLAAYSFFEKNPP
jgi:diacylglycerol kinase family enzyme